MWYGVDLDMNRNWSNSSSESSDTISNEGEGAISSTRQTNTSDNTGKSYTVRGNMSYNFGEDRKYNFHMNMSIGRNESDGASINKSESHFWKFGDSVRMVDHRIYTPDVSNNYNLYANLQRRIGDIGYLGLGYTFSYNDSKSIQSYEDLADDGTLTEIDSDI